MTAVSPSRTRSLNLSLFRGGRFYLWLTLLALVLGALSLLYPSTPSYDPYSWLIWGREILHGQLHIAGGSSWKPLPVIFTTVFALFGSAQPNLWLVVARAGAVVTALMSVKLTVRITWSLVSQGRVGALGRSESWLGRTVAVAPAVLAGAAVLICTTFTKGYPGNMMLGYSEGVMTAAFLIAVERAWDGHHRQAFALGIIPCLDRPEVWLVWGVYGLWLMRRDRDARLLVIGLGILMLALWVAPQELGGGSGGIIGLASHAQKNHSLNSAVNSSFPFWDELAYKLWPLVLERLEFASLLLTGYTVYLVVRGRRRLGSWRGAVERYPAAIAAALAGIFGFLWWLGIAVETQAGFAGNPRYAVIGVMLVGVSGCAAYGWACVGLASLVARVWGRIRRRSRAGQGTLSNSSLTWLAAAATLVLLVVFALLPDRFTNRMPTVSSIRYALRYQAELRERFAALIRREGGAHKVIGCGAGTGAAGSMMTNNYQVTMLAWDLDVPIPFIQALNRKFSTKPGPNVVFQDAASPGKESYPSELQMQTWEQAWKRKNGSQYKVVRTDPVTLYMDCSTYSKT